MTRQSTLVPAAPGPLPAHRRAQPSHRVEHPAPPTDRPAGEGCTPLVIGHRGACGYRPEHTREAYRLAAAQGAVSIEPDLVMSADGVLVARHENELSRSTDVADRPEFASRRASRVVEGTTVTGWFTEDFTAAELKRLRAREPHPAIRPANTWWEGRGLDIVTLDEVLDLAQDLAIGVHAEIKHAHHFAAQGLDPAAALVATLAARPGPAPALTAMAFEPSVLRRLRSGGWSGPLVQLVDRTGSPADVTGVGSGSRAGGGYRAMLDHDGLAGVADYADALGVHKDLVLTGERNQNMRGPSALVESAHRAGLDVLAWTVRAENAHLPARARIGSAPQAYGDITSQVAALARAGVDGILTDHPDLVVNSLAHR